MGSRARTPATAASAMTNSQDATQRTRGPLVSPQGSLLLSLIRRIGPCSRAELASLTGLSKGVLAIRLRELANRGLIGGEGPGHSTGGRPPTMLQLEPASAYVLSVAIAHDHVEAGVANLGAEPEFVLRSEVGVGDEAERQKALDAAGALLERVLEECAIPRERIHGIGVGVEGPVEIPTGTLHPVSPLVEPINVRAFFEKAYPWPVLVQNDVNVLAMAEAWSGAARDVSDFLYVKLGGGLGVGSGMVCRGQVYHGAQGWAGEMGHVPVPEHHRRCSCGKTGCLVTIASGQALAQTALELAREGRSPFLAGLLQERGDLAADDLVEALRARDHAAADAIREAGNCVGQVLGTVVSLTNPALILIGGGSTRLHDLLLSAIRETVYRCALPLSARDLSIQAARMGPEAPLVGAAAMTICSVWGMTAYEPPREFATSRIA